MAKAACHIHIYYHDMWEDLKKHLENITIPYDLFITLGKDDNNLRLEILKFKHDTKIIMVENLGYDVGPFIHFLNMIKLDEYDYVIKIHTKRNVKYLTYVGAFNVSFEKWRENLLSFLKNKENFNKCLDAFNNDEKLGMVGNFRLITRKEHSDKKSAENALRKIQEIALPKLRNVCYIAGTMFIAKANIFKKIQDMNIKITDFTAPDKEHSPSLAHMFERLIGTVVVAQNYKIYDPYSPKLKQCIESIFFSILRFFFRAKYTKRMKLRVKIMKIPVPSWPFSLFIKYKEK